MINQSVCFASGPCAKRKNWDKDYINSSLIGRSHRSTASLERINETFNLLRKVLKIPKTYHIAFTPAGITGSVELGMWNLLTSNVVCIVFDVFARHWHNDIKNQLQIKNITLLETDDWAIPDCSKIDFSNDVIFVYSATTTAHMFNNLDWIPDNRAGLTFCDAASSAFIVDMDWTKLDVTSFGFQKGLGCEANQGVIVLSPNAMHRFSEYKPNWPVPKILRMTKEMFQGATINTPSMMCIEEYFDTLQWADSVGGIIGLNKICFENKKVIDDWFLTHTDFRHVCKRKDNEALSNTCFEFAKKQTTWDEIRKIKNIVESKKIGYDFLGHALWKPCFRVWHGPTVERNSLEFLLYAIGNLVT